MNVWKLRRARRWGSEPVGSSYATRDEAEADAKRDIEAHGNVGRIEHVDGRTVYYTVHKEEA